MTAPREPPSARAARSSQAAEDSRRFGNIPRRGGEVAEVLSHGSERARYRSRGAVEREFGRLKHEWALLPLRVRGIERVRLHADLTILAKLATALSRARAVPLAA
jgi:hypothetical protein